MQKYFKPQQRSLIARLLIMVMAVTMIFPSFNGGTAHAAAPEPSVSRISVTPPTQTVYTLGEGLVTAGTVVQAVYSDGTMKEIALDDVVITGFEAQTAGTQSISVTYTDGQNYTDNFKILVLADGEQPTGISITPPDITEYTVGATELSTVGLVARAVYSDQEGTIFTINTPIALDDLEITGFNTAEAGTKTITVTSIKLTYSDTFIINVIKGAFSPTLIEMKSEWKYLDDGSNQGAGWLAMNFDDSGWKNGAAPLGYANSGKGLDLATWIGYGADKNNKFITSYFRKEIQLSDVAEIKTLTASLIRDDGAVIYLNGTEVYRVGMPAGAISNTTLANETIGDERNRIDFKLNPSLLLEGTNVITAEVHQSAANSSDTFFAMELTALDEVHGLKAEYYTNSGAENFDFLTHTATIVDSQINFSNLEPILKTWTGQSDRASVRWTGQIMPEFSEDYTFSIIGDNGFRLWIDNQLIIDHWVKDWDIEYNSNPITLVAGQKYDMKIEYFEDEGGSNLFMRWASPSVAKQIVPSEAFYLPVNYNAPISGVVSSDGLQVELQFSNNFDTLPSQLTEHLKVLVGDKLWPLESVAISPENPSALQLKLSDPIQQNNIITVEYDGNSDLKSLAGDSIKSFFFSPVNSSQVVKYTLTNIAMNPGRDETELNFAWYSPRNVPTSIVQFAKKADMTGTEFPVATAATFTGSAKNATEGFASNKVTVTGIEPFSEYVYRVGDGLNGHWSEVYDYTTYGSKEYSFMLVGDPQIGASGSVSSDTAGWNKTLNTAVNNFPNYSFIMSMGDQVNTSNDENQYTAYLSPEVLHNLPVSTTVGNHDRAVNYNYHFNQPNESVNYGVTEAGGDYYYMYGDTLFMVLNSNNMSATTHKVFMQETMAAHPDANWNVVTMHHSIYSAAVHSTDTEIINFRAAMFPVFDELEIDTVFMGHDHVYVRAYQMKGEQPLKDQLQDTDGLVNNPEGTMYVTANSASGSKYYELKPTAEAYSKIRLQLKTPTFATVNVTSTSLKITTYRTDNMEIIDTYGIKKDRVETPEPVILEGISVTAPTQTSYKINEATELNTLGMSVEALYSDDSTEVLDLGDITISGFDTTTVGTKTITVTYSLEGKAYTATFVITVHEAETVLDSDPLLANLSVNTGTLSPAFAPSTLAYKVEVANSVNSLQLFISKTSSTQVISVTGAANSSEKDNMITYLANLAVGVNTLQIAVTAEDGTNATYAVTITRQSANLPVNGGGSPTPTPIPTPISTGGSTTGTIVTAPIITDNNTDNNNPGGDIPKVDSNPENTVILNDVSSHWASSQIQQAVKLGFITGYEDKSFRPDKKVNRAEFVTMLGRALKLTDTGGALPFGDTGQIPAFALAYVQQVMNAGLINGFEDNTFRADHEITRTEMTVIIVRALGLKVDVTATLSFSDAGDIPKWAIPYISAAVDAGLISGKGDNQFAPNESATRAESVKMILQLLEK